jgi:hypothetical protein
MDIPSTGVQTLRPHAAQNAATVRVTRLRGESCGLGVPLAVSGSLGYLQAHERRALSQVVTVSVLLWVRSGLGF